MAFAATQEDDFIEGTPYRIDKIAKKIAQKKLYFLGYNPFDLPEDSNYLKKFEGDKEIEELNNTKSEFRFQKNDFKNKFKTVLSALKRRLFF